MPPAGRGEAPRPLRLVVRRGEKTMRIAYTLFTAMLLVGCTRSNDATSPTIDEISLAADVVVKCSVLSEGEYVRYILEEIWRDNSSGIFTNNIGDQISFGPPKQAKADTKYGQHVVCFYKAHPNIEEIGAVAVHHGYIPKWDDISVDKLKKHVLKAQKK